MLLLGTSPQEFKSIMLKEYLYSDIHCNIVHNIAKK